jgi:hypothetical protein
MDIRRSLLVLAALCIFPALLPARDWMGIKSKQPPLPTGEKSVVKPQQKADTAQLDLSIRNIPVGSPGTYLGVLEGVRCFNCEKDAVILNVGDSLSMEATLLSLRIEMWNAIERPLKDKRIFDFANRCFYFGYKEIDTIYVGGGPLEIKVQDVPCYPYLKRVANSKPAAPPVPEATVQGPVE